MADKKFQVLVGNKVAMSQQCDAAKTATSLLGCIRQGTACKRRKDPHPPFSTGEGHMECCAQCWAPWYKRSGDVLGQVLLKATKMIKDLEHNYLKGGFSEEGISLFCHVLSERT